MSFKFIGDSLNVRVFNINHKLKISVFHYNSNIFHFGVKNFCKLNNRGYSLTGKTAILHIVNSGSMPDISK